MIKASNITKRFDNLEVLKGIDLSIAPHEVVSIVGASGAGKTTLLQILGTLSTPDSGEVRINDTNIATLSERELAAFRCKNIGFVFQFHQLLAEFTALENVMLPAMIAGEARSTAEQRAKELLRYLNLQHRTEHKPSELSGGEKQRVAVARALINNPKVILADEPSGSLDSKNKEELHQLVFKLNQDFGHTFVLVTHDEQLAHLCHRTITMQDGRIVNSQ